MMLLIGASGRWMLALTGLYRACCRKGSAAALAFAQGGIDAGPDDDGGADQRGRIGPFAEDGDADDQSKDQPGVAEGRDMGHVADTGRRDEGIVTQHADDDGPQHAQGVQRWVQLRSVAAILQIHIHISIAAFLVVRAICNRI